MYLSSYLHPFFPGITLLLTERDTLGVGLNTGLKLGLPGDLFTTASNLALAATLVLVTLGPEAKGFRGAAAAIGLMTLCHALIMISLFYKFLVAQNNMVITVSFPKAVAAVIEWAHTFDNAQMAYVFFPFLV